MPKTALIHAGPHKTGSTYLQLCFAHHRAALLARGVALPEGWDDGPGNPSHTGLVLAVQDGAGLAAARDVVARAFARADTLLISAEGLASQDQAALQRLREVIGDAETTVIYYVRRWSDLIPSAWQESIKQGLTVSLPEHMAALLRDPEGGFTFNLDKRLAGFAAVFGMERIRLVSYSALRDNGRDLFGHFAAHFLGWPDAPAPPSIADVNRSRGAEEIELIRQLNVLAALDGKQPGAALRVAFDAAPNPGAAALMKAMSASRRVLPFGDNAGMLGRLHRQMHAKYEACVVRPAPPHLFFAPKRRDLDFIASDYLLLPGMAEACRDLYGVLAEAAFGGRTQA